MRLMDDPLQSLDYNVASRVIKSIKNEASSRTPIFMAVGNLKFLSSKDRVLYLEKGEIKYDGNFNKLGETIPDFESKILEGENKETE